MGIPNTFIPKTTEAGKAAAIAANNLGLSLTLTHAALGTGQYDPTGDEVQLFNEVARLPVTGGMRPRPNQMRVAGVWADHMAESEIGEVGFYAGDVLVSVWSRSVGGPIGYKTVGVDFVLFCELVFEDVPPGSVNVVINTDVSEGIAALVVHEVADDAHTQYLLRSQFVDAHSLMTAMEVAGSANAISLMLPPETVLAEGYKAGQQVVFVASASNTGPVTVNINGIGVRSIRKSGSVSLAAGDILAGSVYTLFYDGLAWQMSSGVGGGASMMTYPFVATEGQKVFTFPHVPGNTIVALNGRILTRGPAPAGDYVGDSGESIELHTPASAGDQLQCTAFKSFAMADAYTKDAADTRFIAAAQAKVLSPPGMVAAFAMDAPPTGWLRANGAAVSRTTYADLFAAIGIRYGAGDGSTTFRLPDLRGEFVRGWDDGRGIDAGRAIGSAQAGSIESHDHETYSNGKYRFVAAATGGPSALDMSGSPSAHRTGTTGGAETRPRNIAQLYCIKF